MVDHFAVHEFADNKNGSRMRLAEAIERALIESDVLVTISFGDQQEESFSQVLGSPRPARPDHSEKIVSFRT